MRPSTFVRTFISADDPVRIEFEAACVRIHGGDGEYPHPICPECMIVRESGWNSSGWNSPTNYWARETTIYCHDHQGSPR